MDIESFLIDTAQEVEAALSDILDSWDSAPPVLVEATRYSLMAGGKRLRPALVLEAARLIGGDLARKHAMPAACALEMIHTYSLTHDDLPAMDDDDLRRGKPTLHKAYDEATAILVGDGLLTMAFDVAAQTGNIDVIREISQAAGVGGMVGGQFIDLAFEGRCAREGRELTLEDAIQLHKCKTGAMIVASLRCGVLCAGGDDEKLHHLTKYGWDIGLAFQIADDILDVTGDESTLGKPIGSDEGNDKSTYVSLFGLEGARDYANLTIESALKALDTFGPEADTLRTLARYIVERDR